MAPAKKVNHQSSVETTKQGKVPQMFEPISTFFEKKVRNIEKRKAKLETYRQLKKEGKLTDAGQKQAVEKYDEVQATLTFASTIMQELLPVLLEISNSVEKSSVDREKERDRLSKNVIRSVLDIQDLYEQLGDEKVRSCFASGTEDAVMLTEDQLASIDSLYSTSKPSRCGEGENFKSKAEYKKSLDESVMSWHKLLQKTESKEKPGEMQPSEMKTLFDSIGTCAYFEASRKKVPEVPSVPEVNNNEPIVEVEEIHAPLPEKQMIEPPQLPQPPVVDNHDTQAAVAKPADILGSLQGRAVNFVQDDFGNHMQAPIPVVTSSMMPVATEIAFNGGMYQNTYSDLTSNMQHMTMEPTAVVPTSFGHFNGNIMHEEPPSNPTPPAVTNNTNLFSAPTAPQGTFPAAESWADEAPDVFEKNMTNGGDNFTEVKRGGGPNNRYSGRQNDYGRGGGGGYRNEYPPRGRGGYDNRGRGGYDNRNFNRPYRNDFKDDQNHNGNRQEGGGYYRGGGGRPYGGGGRGRDFRSGQGDRGGRPQRGGFDRPPQMFTNASAAK